MAWKIVMDMARDFQHTCTMQNIDSLPAYTISEESKKAKQIKELSMDREYLVEERTRLKNHLHNLLHRIWNTEYQEKFKDPFTLKALRYWSKAKPKDCLIYTMRFLILKKKWKYCLTKTTPFRQLQDAE